MQLRTSGGFDEATLGAARVFEDATQWAGVHLERLPQGWSQVPLIRIAHGRSGDKGDKANIGIFAREARWLPVISAWLTPERVGQWFAHNRPSRVQRWDLPGSDSINFLLHDVLGGGGMASLRTDNLAKCYAQVLLTLPVPLPPELVASLV
jgi:hypothetical protein